MRHEEQQVSGHYGMCSGPGHPRECPRCAAARWVEDSADDEEPIQPTTAGRSRIVLLVDPPSDPTRPTQAEIDRGIEL